MRQDDRSVQQDNAISFRVKSLLPSSLLGRSLLILIVPMILLQLVTMLVFFERHLDTVTRRLSGALAGDIAMYLAHLRAYPGAQSHDWITQQAHARFELQIRFTEDAILPNHPEPAVFGVLERELTKALEERVRRPFSIDTGTYGNRVRIDVQLSDGVLEIYAPRKRLFSSTTYIFLMWMAGSSLVFYGIAVVFMRNQVRPIRRLAVAADHFGRGVPVPGFKPEGATEVRQAAKSLIDMRDRIERHVHQRTALLAGVSHDLRTPLTRMKLELAMLEQTETADALQQDVAEMDRMIDGYLAFARGEAAEKPVATDIGALLVDSAADARRTGQKLDLHVEETARINLRREAFARCLANLMSNAGRYARHLWIRAGRRGRHYEIVFDDDGPGIAPEKHEDVFKPFYRIESSRNQATGGVGLGLTIARDAIRVHGGDIALEESPKGGLRVRLRLPL